MTSVAIFVNSERRLLSCSRAIFHISTRKELSRAPASLSYSWHQVLCVWQQRSGRFWFCCCSQWLGLCQTQESRGVRVHCGCMRLCVSSLQACVSVWLTPPTHVVLTLGLSQPTAYWIVSWMNAFSPSLCFLALFLPLSLHLFFLPPSVAFSASKSILCT